MTTMMKTRMRRMKMRMMTMIPVKHFVLLDVLDSPTWGPCFLKSRLCRPRALRASLDLPN